MNPECPKCEATSTRRRTRDRSLRHRIYYFFGKFPWECLTCQTIFFHTKRYSRSHRHHAGEVYTGNPAEQSIPNGVEERRSH